MSGAIDTDASVAAIRRTVCCGCGGPLPRHGVLNMVLLDRRAEWSGSMVWGNILVPGSGPRAVSVMCNSCMREGIAPKTAIEVRENGSVVHHPIDQLVEVPEITEADLPR